VIQRFVKCSGPKAFVCRTVYKREGRPYCWIITSKSSFKEEEVDINQRCCTTIGIKDSCTAVHAKTGKYLEQTLPQLKSLIQYVENNLKVKFDEFVADFVKDP
jgi:LMBR1 domain-containing protein 1